MDLRKVTNSNRVRCNIRPVTCGNACSALRRGRSCRIWRNASISWPIWLWFEVGKPCYIAPVSCVLNCGKLRTVVVWTGFDNRVLPLRTSLRMPEVRFRSENSSSLPKVRIAAERIESDVFPVAVELTGTHELIVDAIDGDFSIVNHHDSRAFLHG